MGDRHVVSDVNKQMLYIDAKSLYAWALSQYLPTGNFDTFFLEHYSQEQVVEDLSQIPDNTYRFFIKNALAYPTEIKQLTEKFPLCPYQVEADFLCLGAVPRLYE